MNGSVLQLSVKPRTPGQRGLPKRAVPSVRISAVGADGDYNHYRTTSAAGDPDMAILLVTEELLNQLRAEGWPMQPGDFGENITVRGVAEASLLPGSRVTVGPVELEVSLACDPCTELYVLPYVGGERGPEFVKTTMGRRGWYCRVLKEGQVQTGAPVSVRPPQPAAARPADRPVAQAQ